MVAFHNAKLCSYTCCCPVNGDADIPITLLNVKLDLVTPVVDGNVSGNVGYAILKPFYLVNAAPKVPPLKRLSATACNVSCLIAGNIFNISALTVCETPVDILML